MSMPIVVTFCFAAFVLIGWLLVLRIAPSPGLPSEARPVHPINRLRCAVVAWRLETRTLLVLAFKGCDRVGLIAFPDNEPDMRARESKAPGQHGSLLPTWMESQFRKLFNEFGLANTNANPLSNTGTEFRCSRLIADYFRQVGSSPSIREREKRIRVEPQDAQREPGDQ